MRIWTLDVFRFTDKGRQKPVLLLDHGTATLVNTEKVRPSINVEPAISALVFIGLKILSRAFNVSPSVSLPLDYSVSCFGHPAACFQIKILTGRTRCGPENRVQGANGDIGAATNPEIRVISEEADPGRVLAFLVHENVGLVVQELLDGAEAVLMPGRIFNDIKENLQPIPGWRERDGPHLGVVFERIADKRQPLSQSVQIGAQDAAVFHQRFVGALGEGAGG